MEILSKNTYKKRTYPERAIQFGEGNFLRAFVDWQIDILNKQGYFNGSVVVVQPLREGLVDQLNEQDGLYTLYLQGIKCGNPVREHAVIESISRGINPYEQYDEYLDLAKNPDIRFIFSNTTEAGIAFDENDRLNDRPQNSFPGKLAALLYKRFQCFNGDRTKGFIIIPCELIDNNGLRLKEVILEYAKLWNLEEEFIHWILEANTFCNSLVDRIVPGYPVNEIEEVTKELGYEDRLVDVGEQFHLWVIEGPLWIREEFPAHHAGLNTLFVDDLSPYRTRKVRILNGAHTAMTPVAYLYGLQTVREAAFHDVVGKFINDLIFKEILPVMTSHEEELQAFAREVLDRFRNPFIEHYLMSISLNSMSKFKTRNLPTLLDYIAQKKELPKRLAFSLAALMAFYRGKRGAETINLSDTEDVLALFEKEWAAYDGTMEGALKLAGHVLGSEKLWETDLNQIEGLTDAVGGYLYEIQSKGIETALEQLLEACERESAPSKSAFDLSHKR